MIVIGGIKQKNHMKRDTIMTMSLQEMIQQIDQSQVIIDAETEKLKSIYCQMEDLVYTLEEGQRALLDAGTHLGAALNLLTEESKSDFKQRVRNRR